MQEGFIMSDIRIHVFHTGEVCVAPDLPFGGDNSNAIKASGVFGKKEDRLWLPVSAYLIEHPQGKFLVDTGWAREMSPNGEFDKKAQIKSLGSVILYEVNQGRIGLGQCIDEQLLAMGIKDSDIDAVLLTHLDCDHANGLPQVKGAKKFLVSADELKFASKATNRVRYYKGWWKDTPLTTFDWNDTQGPVGKSYDLLGDGSIELINIPGHADGLFAVKVKNASSYFSSLTADMRERAGKSRSLPVSRQTSSCRSSLLRGSASRAWILTAWNLWRTMTRISLRM